MRGTAQRWTGALLVLVCTTVAAWSVLSTRSTGVVGADSPAGVFSAQRAERHVDAIAREPRPLGSPANARVRAYLLAQLRELGLEPRVQTATVARRNTGYPSLVGRVHNVHAQIPGRAEGRIIVMAHYDSVAAGPGATDDATGVAVAIEVARALTQGPPPSRTVEILLTDGEEPGLLGAQAFSRSSLAGSARDTVVLNVEARGTHGPVVMFETGEHSLGLVRALGDHPPVATSVADEIYRLLPNDTDFTAMREAGFTGLNFAVVEGSARYDNELDTLRWQRTDVLQQMGEVVLSALRRLDATGPPADGADAVYFTTLGIVVSYPEGWALPLALVTAAALVLGLWSARRRGLARLRHVAVTAMTLPLPVLVTGLVGWVAWWALRQARPHLADFLFGDPYRPGLALVGLLVLSGVVGLVWVRECRRLVDAGSVTHAVLLTFVLLALATSWLVPGASYLFVWPALAGSLGLLAQTARLQGSVPPLPTLCAAPVAAALFAPLVAVLAPTVGLALVAAPMVVALLGLLPVLPALGVGDGTRRPRGGAVAAGATIGVVLVALGAVREQVDATHPAQVSLNYVYDADNGRSTWYSPSVAGGSWLAEHVGTQRHQVQQEVPPLDWPDGYRRGVATPTPVPTPTATVLGERTDGDLRTVRAVVSAQGMDAISLYSSGERVLRAEIDGVPVPAGTNRPGLDPWTWGVHLAAPEEQAEVSLVVRGPGPLEVKLVGYGTDVPEEAFESARPADVRWSPAGLGARIGIRAVTW